MRLKLRYLRPWDRNGNENQGCWPQNKMTQEADDARGMTEEAVGLVRPLYQGRTRSGEVSAAAEENRRGAGAGKLSWNLGAC